MSRIRVKCPMCKEIMSVSKDGCEINHFYCEKCKQVHLVKDIDWSEQMSTKSTLLYARTDDITFHFYYCIVKGYGVDIRYKDFNTTLSSDKEQINSLIRQLTRKH